MQRGQDCASPPLAVPGKLNEPMGHQRRVTILGRQGLVVQLADMRENIREKL
jgi:hypothetical protein